jgi:hypothetical protein
MEKIYPEFKRFIKHNDNTMVRIIQIKEKCEYYVIKIPLEKWNRRSSQNISKIITNIDQLSAEGSENTSIWDKNIGEIIKTNNYLEYINPLQQFICVNCSKIYKSKGGYYKHKIKCSKLIQNQKIINSLNQPSAQGEWRKGTEDFEENIIIESPYKVKDGNFVKDSVAESVRGTEGSVECKGVNNNPTNLPNNINISNNEAINIQNNTYNIVIRSLGKENPRWLTSTLLFQAISDIPKAIPKLMEKKHFNDEFPENKNLRVDTKRTLDRRLRVFEDGRWKIKDSKQTFYRVLVDIYDILSDALEGDNEEEQESTEELEEEKYTKKEMSKLKKSQKFIRKLERIQPLWESLKDKIQDERCRNELWEDLKTLLLDRQIEIEQGFD